MQQNKNEFFSSRWAFLFAALGMAIGAGNIWRFPRLAGQYGGSFLIPWILFLFLWSIPLIIIEFSIGKKLRLSVISSFSNVLGKKYAWMGWFIAMCTIGIMFYYSVVCGWSLKYFSLSLTGNLSNLNHAEFWSNFTSGNVEALFFFIVSVLIGCFVILGGVSGGIEKATKVLVPALFVLILISAIRALTLPGAGEGLYYFFRVNLEDLSNYKIWLEALSQSAWSTGAGWGLILTYSTYVKKRENSVTNSLLTGLGNNLASILVGLAVIPTVFALSPNINLAKDALAAGNQGLTFIYIPQLFNSMPFRDLFSSIFFLALFIASISSLIAMFELANKVLMDYGLPRKNSVIITGICSIIFGIPSALSLKFFNNQDWVWGIGLLLSGFFFIFLVLKIGMSNFIFQFLNEYKDFLQKHLKKLKVFFILMVFEFLIMITWWFFQSINWYPLTWWHPFEEFSLGTCVMQWGLLILLGIVVTKKLYKNKHTTN
jgi:neurotransmitter:Na+ symporter, NSS family